jgi:hypothetical protein
MTRVFLLALALGLLSAASALAQTITAPTGTVTTSDGAVWSWGGTAPQTGQYYVLRNGVSAEGGEATVMEVSGGALYAENTAVPPGTWFLWNGSGWTPEASAPSAGGGTTTPTQPSGSGPTLLTGSITLTAPLANWYLMKSSSLATITLPPCSAISASSYFDTTGTGPLVLQLSSGSWVDQPPGAQTVGLWVYGPSATAWVSSDGTNCHISFGGAPPAS